MTEDGIRALFTRGDGRFLCARWARPVVPVVFGVDDATLSAFKDALVAVCRLAGHPMAETDAELGANLMVFVARSWDEIAAVPNLDRLIPDLPALLIRLRAAGANQYRVFRFEPTGAIRAAFVLLVMDRHLSTVAADVLALAQAVQTIVLWSDTAFLGTSPLIEVKGQVMLRPDIGAVIRAVYDPVLPVVATDPAHALRLLARVGTVQ